MEILFGAAKINKYSVNESGDTLEMIERPHGGLSIILVDGQRSGKSAKKISNVVARKCVQLLGEGVRDGVVARAANDYLFTYRDGKVTATLNMISADATSRTIVIARNNPCPVLVHTPQRGLYQIDDKSESIGTRRSTKPQIIELPMELGPLVIAFTDGIRNAGTATQKYDFVQATQNLLNDGMSEPQEFADHLLKEAFELEQGRPKDDISIMAMRVRMNQGDKVRRVGGRIVF